MNYVYFDAFAGLSGDMILGALLDLGVSSSLFKEKMAELGLPVEIRIQKTKRSSLRAMRVDVRVKEKKVSPRRWRDVASLIEKSPFSSTIKTNALSIFKRLFEVEARVHGHRFEEAHLHEAGADDAVIDIVGTCFLAETLRISAFYSSPLNVGHGWVKGSHGVLPVPAPASAELLKDIPVYSAWVEEELVTPTGAAIISSLVKKFLSFPEISYKKIGYGAGRRDFPEFPNILRAFYGEKKQMAERKKVYIVEANIDDSSPQVLGSLFDTALKKGALDVFLTPVFMKKNRMATKLTLLAEIDKIDSLIETVFQETSTIGVRLFPVERRVLERKSVHVKVLEEKVAIKVAYLEGRAVNAQPEYADCLRLAKKNNLPLRKVFQLALEAFSKQGEAT
ncbi:MAG: nickel pincer cofactor biosynthesis protein LarC [Candidatus Aminicenantales bacterium]